MKFTLTIDCNNAAFEESAATEIGLILADLAESNERIALHGQGILFDSNGNIVGRFDLTAD